MARSVDPSPLDSQTVSDGDVEETERKCSGVRAAIILVLQE
ncbi:MAG TPA: hypothetical protein VG796_30565 [Verrucomicrobiales bacterium]|nr:hypothetical protein [Verrucomicrobiales bacterium]